MARDFFLQVSNRKAGITVRAIAVAGVLLLMAAWMTYATCRIDVGPDEFCVLIRNNG